MCDLQLMYRECGAETRDDYLRGVAHENGLPIACVQRLADSLGEREDFGALLQVCEQGGTARAVISASSTPSTFIDF